MPTRRASWSVRMPRGREDRHPETVEDARDVGLLAVDAPAGPAHPAEPRDRTPPLGVVLELNDELLLRALAPLGVVVYVALLLEDAGYLRLHLRVRHRDRIVLRYPRVADAGQ